MKLMKLKFVVAAIAIGMSPLAYADRVCTHGQSGLLEDPNVDFGRYGWGLRVYPTYLWEKGNDFDTPRSGDWIHYSIPVSTGDREPFTRYDLIRIRVNTSANMAEWGYGDRRSWIDSAHIYNGEQKIKTDDTLTDWIVKGPQYLEIQLDNPTIFWNAIGVSLKVTTLTKGEWIEFLSVCAFEEGTW